MASNFSNNTGREYLSVCCHILWDCIPRLGRIATINMWQTRKRWNPKSINLMEFHRWKRYEFGFCPIPEHCGLAAFPAHRAPLCATCLDPAQLRGSTHWLQRISLTKLQKPDLENAIVSQFHILGSRIICLNWTSLGPVKTDLLQWFWFSLKSKQTTLTCFQAED